MESSSKLPPALPLKPTAAMFVGGPFLLPSKVDMDSVEEQPFDFSRKYNETLDDLDSREAEVKSMRVSSGYQDDDCTRVYCTEGTPSVISRASSVGDLSSNQEKRRPETIYEHKQESDSKVISQTATANATPQVWSRVSSPSSLSSFCLTGAPAYDAHSIASEFSRQPSGLISPSDLPDSPGQTMPSSPKDSRSQIYPEAKHPNSKLYSPYGYSNDVPREIISRPSPLPQARFTGICLAESKMEKPSIRMVRPNPEPRQLRSFTEPKPLLGEYLQEDCLHNYRTEDTPANLSAATSFSDLSSICPKSDYHGPVPRPRRRKVITPLSNGSPHLPLKTSHASDLFACANLREDISVVRSTTSQDFPDNNSDVPFGWKPRTLPRKLRANLPIGQELSYGGSNKSMPELSKDDVVDSGSNSEDDELLRQAITKGRPKSRQKPVIQPKPVIAQARPEQRKACNIEKPDDSDSEDSDNQEILEELIKLGRPASRNQLAIFKGKSSSDARNDEDRYQACRSMEDLNGPTKVVKKGTTSFVVREQPLRTDRTEPKPVVTRAHSLKGSKSLGYDHVSDRRQTKTPEPVELARFDPIPHTMHSTKPVSRVSPIKTVTPFSMPSTSSPNKKSHRSEPTDNFEEGSGKQVLLSPLRSSVRQSRQTCVKSTKSTDLSGECSESGSDEFPPRPPKPPQFRPTPGAQKMAAERLTRNDTPDRERQTPDIQETPDAVEAVENVNEDVQNNNLNGNAALQIGDAWKLQVPPEPPEDSGDITVLSFKLPSANRSYTRRFLASSEFSCVLNYLACKGFPMEKYRVVVSSILRIKREIRQSSFTKTLHELKMVPKKTLTIKPR